MVSDPDPESSSDISNGLFSFEEDFVGVTGSVRSALRLISLRCTDKEAPVDLDVPIALEGLEPICALESFGVSLVLISSLTFVKLDPSGEVACRAFVFLFTTVQLSFGLICNIIGEVGSESILSSDVFFGIVLTSRSFAMSVTCPSTLPAAEEVRLLCLVSSPLRTVEAALPFFAPRTSLGVRLPKLDGG